MKTVSTIINLSNIKLEGIMTILPLKKTQRERECLFLKTKKIRDHISKKHKIPLELSMGMSGDYRDAIACGSTLIRVGSKIFGIRV